MKGYKKLSRQFFSAILFFFSLYFSLLSVKNVQADVILLDDFATWRFGNGGDIERLFDVYNRSVGNEGPNQVALGVLGNAFQATVPADNVWYVDQDDAPYTATNQWMKGHIKSGTWDPDINRMVFLVRSTINSGFAASGSNNMNVGTYVKPLDNFSPGAEGTIPQNGHHYYHGYTTPVTANKWMKVYVTNRTQHERGDPGSVDGALIPNYFHTMTRFYVTHWGTYPGNPSSTWDLGPIYLYKEIGEPDNDISSETIQYNGTKYQVTWAGRKNVDVTYEIRYRLDGASLKTTGFTSGTNGGTATNPGNDYTGVYWELTVPESTQGIYVGIRVQGASQFTELFLPYQVSPTNMGLPGMSPAPDTTPPTSPTNLAATSPSQSSISVSWTASTDPTIAGQTTSGVTGYIVERCQGSGCSNFAQVGTPTASPFVDSGLTANTFYNYHVRARDAAGNLSGWSNVVGATTQAPDTTPPTAPTSLSATASSSSNINLTWTASTDTVGVTGYRVERCSGASCTTFTQIGTPTATSYSDTGLTASTTYRYRVRAIDAANNLSSYSTIANATTPETPPVSASLMVGYNFNEGTGTTTADISGHNHTGTLSATTWSTGGKYGNALNFNGSTSFVETPNTSSLNITGSAITLSAWVYPDTLGTNMLIAKPVSGTSHSAPYFSYSLHLYPSGTPRFYLTLGGSSYSVSSSVIPQVGTWSHLAGVYNGNTMKIYVNGVESGSISASGNITGYATPLRLGVNGGLEENFDGRLDDVRIYNKALTQTEIQTDMNTPLTGGGGMVACNTVTTGNFSQSAYNSYGAPYDAFQTSTNLMNTTCTSADTHTINLTTGVTGDTTRIVYTKGYWYDAVTTAWRQYTGTCTGALNGEWCQGSVSATITDPNVSTASTANPTYLVGMTCSVQGGSWKCGCRDTTCANFSWQIQGAGQ